MIESLPLFLLFLGFFILDVLLVAVRTAFIRSNPARWMAPRENEERAARRALKLLNKPGSFEAGILQALILTRFGMAALLGIWLLKANLPYMPWIGILAVLAAAILLFWFEWWVRGAAARNPESWALRLARFGSIVQAVMSVFVWPVRGKDRRQSSAGSPSGLTEDELLTLVDAGQEEGVVEQGERQMIISVLHLGDTLAREIMVPRIDMLALEVETPLGEAISAVIKSGHSRIPVYEDTVDQTLGLVYAKDLLRTVQQESPVANLRDLLRPAYFVPEAKRVDELLAEMQRWRIHMAIVVDEYGGVAGLVTLEDIVEEIVGEIRDEYDQAEEAPYMLLKDGDYLFSGKIALDDFNDVMGSNLNTDEADTLAGLIYNQLGRVPEVGEGIRENEMELTVEQVSKRRIIKVRAHRVPAHAGGEESHGSDE